MRRKGWRFFWLSITSARISNMMNSSFIQINEALFIWKINSCLLQGSRRSWSSCWGCGIASSTNEVWTTEQLMLSLAFLALHRETSRPSRWQCRLGWKQSNLVIKTTRPHSAYWPDWRQPRTPRMGISCMTASSGNMAECGWVTMCPCKSKGWRPCMLEQFGAIRDLMQLTDVSSGCSPRRDTNTVSKCL